MMNLEDLTSDFLEALLSIDRIRALEISHRILNDCPDFSMLENVIIESLRMIGDGWEEGDYALAQVYMSSVICEEVINQYMVDKDIARMDTPRMGMGVFLDHHILGKRIVMSVIKASGYDVIDLGQGLTVADLVQKTLDQDIEVLLISTLMLPSAMKISQVIKELRKSNENIKIIVGGAPFRLDEDLWNKVGADADGKNATDIVRIIERVVNKPHD